jgi:hypothetical protein
VLKTSTISLQLAIAIVTAAFKAGAQVTITANLKDFSPCPTASRPSRPTSSCNLFDLDPEGFADMLREQAVALQNPPVTFDELLHRLARPVPDLIAAVRECLMTGDRA